MYYDLVNKKEVSIGAIRKANPTTSIPKVPKDSYKLPIVDGTKIDGKIEVDGKLIDNLVPNIVGYNEYSKIVYVDTEEVPTEYQVKVDSDIELINGVPTITKKIVDMTDAEKLEVDAMNDDILKAEAQAYLNSTDWYVIRQQETGVAIPQEVLDKRAECRLVL